MKILLGVPEYPPYHIGGGGEVFKNLAENYKELGYEIVVVYGYYPTNSWNENIKEWTDKKGIKFYQIPEIPYPKSMPFLRTVMPCNLKAWLKLRKIVKKENPDVAHLHGYGLLFVNILSKILYKLKTKYIFTIHGYPETQSKSNFLVKAIWNSYIKSVMNQTLKRASKITCISDYIKNDKRNICKEKSVIIFNGINFDDFKNVKDDINIRKKHNIKSDVKIIFSLGRIAKMKGYQEVIKRISDFLRKGVKIKYLIAGEDDGYRKELDELINKLNLKNNVEFVHFLDLETKKQYVKQCDIYAVPSLWEPFGLVVLEGMIFDKVILTTGNGAIREVLDGYDKKVFLDNEDFIQELNQKDKIKTSFDFVKFDWKNIINLYNNLFF